MLVVWCPDWPLVSWGVPMDEPALVLEVNRVVATTPAARAEGVALGQRRREAQGRCPEVVLLGRDLDREARLFDPVVAAVDEFAPRVEVTGPGLVGFPTRGPSRFFGGDSALAEMVYEKVQPLLARRGELRVALADGVFTARLAARTGEPITVVAPGQSAAFLADLPITAIDDPELTEVLTRLGITTLGRFAALSSTDVVGRFGRDGLLAHRLAKGEDDHPPDLRRPAFDLSVSWAFEPPADRIETCAYAAKALAEEFHAGLQSRGLACTRVAIEAETEAGERSLRLWRNQGLLSAADVADRARWQLDSWLHQGVNSRPTSGIVHLSLIPDEVVPATGNQLAFWGATNDQAEAVTRAVARLQTMLGPDSVTVPEFKGGIGPGERIRLVPAAAVDLTQPRPAASAGWLNEPWPGQLPAPSPAKVHADPKPIELRDRSGQLVVVGGRGLLSGDPAMMCMAGRPSQMVATWAGPWPAEQRWWDPLTRSRRARMQVCLGDGSAHLLMVERQSWFIEASYD